MRALRWLGYIGLASATTAALTLLAICAGSEWRLRRYHDAPLQPLLPAHAADAAEGERLAKILGCWAGCHGQSGQGGSLDMEGYYSVTAPPLSPAIASYNDAELARLIRYGVRRDGSSILGMTSYVFYPLGDQDLANVIAHLRRQPTHPMPPRKRSVTLSARLGLLTGDWQLPAEQIDPARPRWGNLPRTTSFERGRYLASVTCSECHGVDFHGNRFNDNTYDGGPSLIVVAAYDDASFRQLLRTGVSPDGRDLGEMAWVARNGFTHFTDTEIRDIHVFLRKYHGLPPLDALPDTASR